MTFHVHDLTVGEPGPEAPVVVAVPGITGNGLNWAMFAQRLAQRFGPGTVRVLAPDLRGRGDSPVNGGRLGLDVHVQDLAELARTLGRAPLVVGHSMGAAVAALLGAKHPGTVLGLVLVDGGLNFAVPAGMDEGDIDSMLRVVLGPAMKRLEMTFESPAAYLEFVSDHPALGPLLRAEHGDVVRRYLEHDVRPCAAEPGRWASSCVLDAIRADGREVMFHPSLAGAVRESVNHGVPVEFLWAPRGLFDEPQGLYDEERLALLNPPKAIRVTKVEDTNHYSIALDPKGIDPVLDAVARLLD